MRYPDRTLSEDEAITGGASPGLQKSKIVRKKRPGWGRGFSRRSGISTQNGQEEGDEGDESNTENAGKRVVKSGGGWQAIRQKLRRHPALVVGEIKKSLTGQELVTVSFLLAQM